jgi:hypothetical protein
MLKVGDRIRITKDRKRLRSLNICDDWDKKIAGLVTVVERVGETVNGKYKVHFHHPEDTGDGMWYVYDMDVAKVDNQMFLQFPKEHV